MCAHLPFSFTLGRWIMHVRPAPLASFIKRLLRIHRHELKTHEGTFWVDPVSDVGQRIATVGSYDPESTAFLGCILKPGDT